MQAGKEMVLYYQPQYEDKKEQDKQAAKARLLKGVLVRLGVRIRNVGPEQAGQQVGFLAGLPGFEEKAEEEREAEQEQEAENSLEIPEEILVLHNFSSRRLDELLMQMRKNKVPPIPLKAVLTEHNCKWSLVQLYEELRAEHRYMTEEKGINAGNAKQQ